MFKLEDFNEDLARRRRQLQNDIDSGFAEIERQKRLIAEWSAQMEMVESIEHSVAWHTLPDVKVYSSNVEWDGIIEKHFDPADPSIISAIKALRFHVGTTLGLKEAKDYVEQYRDRVMPAYLKSRAFSDGPTLGDILGSVVNK